MGEILAGPLYDEVGLISADINLAEIVKARFDLDSVGHYARSDVFQLQVNEQQRKPLHQVGESAVTQEQPQVLFKPE